jgi:hypothetical protein
MTGLPARPGQVCAKTYGVELFFGAVPQIAKGRLLDALRRRSPDVAPVDVERASGPWVFAHRAHRGPAPAGMPPAEPAKCLIGLSENAPDPARLQFALEQSWRWPQAAEVLPQCRASLLVADLMATGLHHLERLILFQNVLICLIEAFPCLAIHWQPTQQMVDPDDFLAAVGEAGGLVFTPGPLNVRLFRIDGDGAAPGAAGPDILMDTLGLAALGLPDLQCHFTGLDPQAVSRVLYNTGIYLFERGNVIEDRHTIPGIRAGDKWRCRRETSLALPGRTVLDLDPGPPFSARDRRAAEHPV